MVDIDTLVERLAQRPRCGYGPQTPVATEPTALAATALLGHRSIEAAEPALAWLAEVQSPDGSLGIDAEHPEPCWPTGWALLAWSSAPPAHPSRWAVPAKRAADWLLGHHGLTFPQTKWGHDTTLKGWSWVEGTHSWVEPTAIGVLGLKAAGYGEHARCVEAAQLLLDRMLPAGGCNMGNTVVLGRTLRAQVQPTGLALAALAGASDPDGRIEQALDYVQNRLSANTPTASLCFGLLGMTAHGARPEQADTWLEEAAHRTLPREASPYKLALIALAALGDNCPWFLHNAVAAL
jgi:hypothetical protein